MHVMRVERIGVEGAVGRGLLCVPLTAAAVAIRAVGADLATPCVVAGTRSELADNGLI
jgi:hypothetical protein